MKKDTNALGINTIGDVFHMALRCVAVSVVLGLASLLLLYFIKEFTAPFRFVWFILLCPLLTTAPIIAALTRGIKVEVEKWYQDDTWQVVFSVCFVIVGAVIFWCYNQEIAYQKTIMFFFMSVLSYVAIYHWIAFSVFLTRYIRLLKKHPAAVELGLDEEV